MTKLHIMFALTCSALLGACASDGGSLFGANETASVAPAPKVDPACVALNSRIDALRREGVTDRMQKAAAGKGATVSVKRESLAKAAELDRANAEFQAKCSTITPRPQSAQAAPAAAAASAPAAGPPAAATKAAPTRASAEATKTTP
jgi:hypothetical protein